MPDSTASDIQKQSWIERITPSSWHPYTRLMRLDRPIGTWLLLFPCWWGAALAPWSDFLPIRWHAPFPDPWHLLLFALGALIMRGAGCTINDIADRDYDRQVARTATRPIASGAISRKGAALFLAVQLLAGLLILLQFNSFTVWLGVASLLLVFPYPLMKRITYWPQAWLGLTFTYGALMGWAAATGGLAAPAVLLYAGCFFWTLHYDTIYAHQDKEDDALVGVKSSALALGERTKPALLIFTAVMIGLWAAAGATAGLGWGYWPLLAGVAGFLVWQSLKVDIHDPKDCLARFKANRFVGWGLLAAILAGQVSAA
ncbi:MAG: 4-hydroxybenzoate octaprenyltransferase [Rhodospirillaceae bacterium]